MVKTDQFLVTPGRPHGLSVFLGRDSTTERELIVLTARAATLSDQRRRPPQALGQSVELRFLARNGEDLLVPAHLEIRHNAEHLQASQYAFDVKPAEREALAERLRRLSNQRVAFRVDPTWKERPTVRLTSIPVARGEAPTLTSSVAEQSVEGELVNISYSGISFQGPRDADASFRDSDFVETRIDLPTSSNPVRMVGILRLRALVRDHVRYGVEFLPDLTLNYAENEDAVAKYVMLRQADMAKLGVAPQ